MWRRRGRDVTLKYNTILHKKLSERDGLVNKTLNQGPSIKTGSEFQKQ